MPTSGFRELILRGYPLKHATLTLPQCILLLVSSAQAQEATRPESPEFQVLRQNEDWSAFKDLDPSLVSDWADPYKAISLSDDGSIWVSIGGHARARLEGWNDFNFGRHPAGVGRDDIFLLTRLLLHTDFHLGQDDRVFIEGKTAQATERDLDPGGRRTIDVDSLDLQQAFWDHDFELGAEGKLTLRLGRQGLQFGNQRLVSPLPWTNTMRSWDGATAIWKDGPCTVTAFYTQFAPVDISDFNEPDENDKFFGVYGTHKGEDGTTYDTYLLGTDRGAAMFNGTSGEEDRYTLGGRINGKVSSQPIDYDVEAAYQFGKVGTGDVSAYMLASDVGYKFADVPMQPRVRVGLDIASGDGSAGGSVGTFNQLFPLGHAYLGYIDAIGRQNIFDLSTGAALDLAPKLTGRFDLHYFRLLEKADALYDAGGGVSVPGGTSMTSSVGTEVDFLVKYKVDRHFATAFGYSHFFAGSVLNDGGGFDDVDFVYASVTYAF